MDLPLELVDTICNLINVKLIRELYENMNPIFLSLNEKRIENYWVKNRIRNLIKYKDFQGVEYLVKNRKMDLNIEEGGDYPIITAIYEGNLEMVKLLYSLGADLYIDNNYPIQFASDSNNLDILKYFIETAKVNISTLQNYSIDFSSGHGYLEMVKYLYSLGLNITKDALEWASRDGKLDIVKYLVSQGDFTKDQILEAIYEAYRGAHLDIVQFLAFTEGIEIDDIPLINNENDNGNNNEINQWMNAACGQGKLDMVKHLVKKGGMYDWNWTIPLRCAIQNNKIEIVKYLVEQERIDITFEIWNTLKIIVCRGYLDLLKYLVSLGIDIKLKNNQAIKDACENGKIEIVKYLIELGADFRVNNDLPIKLASEYNHVEVVRYLHGKGADIHKGPIKIATRSRALDVVKYLVGQGVSIRGCREIAINSPCIYGSNIKKNPVLEYLENSRLNKTK
jgi:ankyrin repeat protein